MCKKGLKSELLDRRITGMKELNQLVRKISPIGNMDTDKFEFLVQWMKENEVFDIIWNCRNTHLQLVQRSDQIFKELLRNKLLTTDLLGMFFNLTRSEEYRVEVFKILNENAFWFEEAEIEFIFGEIMKTPPAKLGLEEFETLSQLGKSLRAGNGNFQ